MIDKIYIYQDDDPENANYKNCNNILYQKNDLLNKIRRVVELLPENIRVPIVSYYFKQKKMKNIALEMNVTERTIRNRIRKGEKLLKNRILKMA